MPRIMIAMCIVLLTLLPAGPLYAAAAPACKPTEGAGTLALDRLAYYKVADLDCAAGAKPWELWLDGMDSGVRSIGCIAAEKLLVFDVSRDRATDASVAAQTWRALLRNPFERTDKSYERCVSVEIKEAGGGKVVDGISQKLRILDPARLWIGVGLILLVIGSLFGMARKSDLLRDTGPFSAAGRRPYRLARAQMAWWFAIVFTSYVLLWLLMHELPVIPTTVLWLIGISAGTSLAAFSVDHDKQEQVQPSAGFWRDISTNAHGVTLYRFQNIAWTGLFGLVFISQVVASLSMPDFDNSVLALMGISAGSYLGFKLPETQIDPSATAVTKKENPVEVDPKSGYQPLPDK